MLPKMNLDQTTIELPRTDHLRPQQAHALAAVRSTALWALRLRWDIRVHDQVFVPTHGPAIIAANHVGTLDGPLAVLVNKRPTFALAKNELFSGPVGWALAQGGQIPLHRDFPDFPALRSAIQVLRQGDLLAIFPEGARDTGECRTVWGGMAYLALVTGAPVVPCAFLGTRTPGGRRGSLPPKGAAIDVVFGHPIPVEQMGWPRRRHLVRDISELLGARLRAHVRDAMRRTGQELPGPVVD